MGFQFLSELTDLGALFLGRRWKGERVKALRLVVSRIMAHAQTATRRKSPGGMQAARKDTEVVGIVQRNRDDHVVGQDRAIEENEVPPARALDGCNVAAESAQRGSECSSRLPQHPPVLPVGRAVV